jgi:hypothetical protein
MTFLLLVACTAPTDSGDLAFPTLGVQRLVVPGPDVPVQTQDSNNNLDVIRFQGRVYFAFRTAPDHFASDRTELHILSSTDEQAWTWETTFAEGTDLREPRFLPVGDTLFLYYAVLGTDPLAFEPQGTRVSALGAAGWSEPEWVFQDGFIPWRARVHEGVPLVMGYTGGDEIYSGEDLPQLQVKWLQTPDGRTFDAATPQGEVMHTGGCSETDWAFTPEGEVIAVLRNEAGDHDGWGSKVCRGEPDAPGDWSCQPDPRKFDSPLVFAHGGRVWLIGRRNVTETGHFDLEQRDLDHSTQTQVYSVDYWQHPKRCSVWEVDADDLSVTWVLDLPSAGDTCFASILPTDEPGRYTVYNYSSDPQGPDLSWLEGQKAPTNIYAQDLVFPF